MANEQHYLKVSSEVARDAGKIFLKKFGHPGKVETKNSNPRDFVTEFDRKIEKMIRGKIRKNFPKHKIIGEEFEKPETLPNDLVWIIDPIDGTTNFIQGIPFCCISIALWDKNGPLSAVVYNPVLDKLYSSLRGQGAFLNGKKIHVSGKDKMVSSFGGYGWGRDVKRAGKDFPLLVSKLNKIRSLGSTAWEICLVASGTYDFQIQAGCKIWDIAAAVLILTEAGGKATDWQGKPVTLSTWQLLSSNGIIHGELLKTLKHL